MPLLLAIASILAVNVPAAAEPPRTPAVTCTTGGLAEAPKFDQSPPGRAQYTFSGVCSRREGGFLGYRLDATWTPSETTPGNANASEVYTVHTLSGPSQSWQVIFGARCSDDPWLNEATCDRVGNNLSDELREVWPELVKESFLFTRRLIRPDQREALRATYARANGIRPVVQLSQVRNIDGRPKADSSGAAERIADGQRTTPMRAIDQAALNPQPLPPKDAGADGINTAPAPQVDRAGRAAEAGIIIVSGTPAEPNVAPAARVLRNVKPAKNTDP
jgi:hypothetical protein